MTSEEEKQLFKNRLCGAISEKCTELTCSNGKITYNDGKNIVHFVHMVFLDYINFVPKEVVAACDLSLAFIAPTLKEKKKLIKNVATTMGGAAGLVAIITGIGIALGWGAGVVAAVTAWFMGGPMLGPIFWIFGGASLAAIAGYFYFSNDDAKEAERFERVLNSSLDKAIDEIWSNYGTPIAAKMTSCEMNLKNKDR